MKKIFLLLALGSVFLLVGCQSSNKLIKTEESLFCTACKSETVTTIVKGLNNTRYKCPKCYSVRQYDDYGSEIIHTCSDCGRALEKCPICREQDD